MPSTDQTLLATAISEVARNITAYAVRGEVLLELVRDGRGRRGIRVVARDEGPGIADLDRALTDGYTTGGGLGLGPPGARRLVDDFEIETAPGVGTTLTLVKWTRQPAGPTCSPSASPAPRWTARTDPATSRCSRRPPPAGWCA